MDADDVGAAEDRGGHRRGGAAQPFVDAATEEMPDEAFSRCPDRQRAAEPAELVQTPQDFHIVLRRLAEADPGVHEDLITGYSDAQREFQFFPKKPKNFGDDVAVP